jgi:alpha-L-fucosidase 2
MQRFDFTWDFPLPRVHTGMLLGNGRMGAMIWGGANVLKITLGRADWWDHRGGKEWTAAMNFRDIRRCLETQDADGMRALFAEPDNGGPARPTIVPVGRFELLLPDGATLVRGRLDRETAVISIDVSLAGMTHTLAIEMCMDQSLVRVSAPGALGAIGLRALPAYETAGEALKKRGIAPPTMIDSNGVVGFTQSLPADPGLTAIATRRGTDIWITTSFDEPAAAIQYIYSVDAAAFEPSRAWWREYWARSPKLCLPNDKIQFLFDYGLYKFAGLTNPLGYPAGLQGAWIEDYSTPPWSGDYHFNINVQMCYSPAFSTGHLSHLRPLFDLIESWLPQLREHARLFVGIDDGLMLPHAVDDRCKIIGSFWTGTVDHGCTAWVGKMMYDYWSHGGAGDDWAKRVMFPFLKGAMRVFEEMLEREGDRFVLPVSVSPEYRGAAMNAWGRDASFQLACIHMLCELLIDLSARFDEPERPIWREILLKLPRACTGIAGGKRRIFLWEGTPLEESHRHHSHLAGITPFDVINPNDDVWRELANDSIAQWIAEGMGYWTGWCMPWAVQLHTRMGNAGMAEMLIEMWQKVFTNEGHGTLHDCEFPGLTLMGAGASAAAGRKQEIMQMDAGMGMVSAIADLLCHRQRGIHYFFRGCPATWEHVAFERIHTEGGFIVSGRRERGRATVSITATRAGTFRYADSSGKTSAISVSAGQTREVEL